MIWWKQGDTVRLRSDAGTLVRKGDRDGDATLCDLVVIIDGGAPPWWSAVCLETGEVVGVHEAAFECLFATGSASTVRMVKTFR